jgi:uncharacterized membrane protein YjjP (DUF1212 family)
MAQRVDDGPATDAVELRAFLLELARALTLAGAAVSETQERLARIAAAYGAAGARIVVLPTAMIVSAGAHERAAVESVPQRAGTWRLDQVSALYAVVAEAERGDIAPAAGSAALQRIRGMPPRHGRIVQVLAYALMTGALCLMLRAGLTDLAIGTGLGLAVGAVVVFGAGLQPLTVLVPVTCATFVSVVAFEGVAHGWSDPGLRILIAPLVTFLPGAALTTATVELASGEMVAGASRLVSGAVQLALLAFGIVAGAGLVGLPSGSVSEVPAPVLGAWAPWCGVVVFGLAAAVHFSAPPRAVGWLLLVLAVAWLGQIVGEAIGGSDVSGFFGALLMTPLALLIGAAGGPPAQVTFLPAFWLLVPGALGLAGVTQALGDPASAGLDDIILPVGAIVSIALGVLCGISLFGALALAASRVSTSPTSRRRTP